MARFQRGMRGSQTPRGGGGGGRGGGGSHDGHSRTPSSAPSKFSRGGGMNKFSNGGGFTPRGGRGQMSPRGGGFRGGRGGNRGRGFNNGGPRNNFRGGFAPRGGKQNAPAKHKKDEEESEDDEAEKDEELDHEDLSEADLEDEEMTDEESEADEEQGENKSKVSGKKTESVKLAKQPAKTAIQRKEEEPDSEDDLSDEDLDDEDLSDEDEDEEEEESDDEQQEKNASKFADKKPEPAKLASQQSAKKSAKISPKDNEQGDDEEDDEEFSDADLDDEDLSDEDEEESEADQEPQKQTKSSDKKAKPASQTTIKQPAKQELAPKKRSASECSQEGPASKRSKPTVTVKADTKLITEELERKKTRDTCTLFVKNLPKKISEDEIKALSVDIKVVRRKSPNCRFCWIVFATEQVCEKNFEKLQNAKLGGCDLVVDFCGEKSKNKPVINDKNSTDRETIINPLELYVGNLQGPTSLDELKRAFPTATDFTCPKHKKPGDKNFAFVTFTSAQEARAAFDKAKNLKISGTSVIVSFSRAKASPKRISVKK